MPADLKRRHLYCEVARKPPGNVLQESGNCALVVGATGGVGQVLTVKLLDVSCGTTLVAGSQT